MPLVADLLAPLSATPHRWLVTGGAGFIGSHLAEALLAGGQDVVVLDNLSTGRRANLDGLPVQSGSLRFLQGDLRDRGACHEATVGVDVILHHGAQVSVPASLQDPMTTHEVNVTGFVNLLEAAREAGVGRVVYASSSAVYGDPAELPNTEARPGACLSPYALSKRLNELWGELTSRVYGLPCVGLRYFNVYGPRQDPKGAYAAVIAAWLDRIAARQPCTVYGDGGATRDFVYVGDVVQANLRAALAPPERVSGAVFNVGSGVTTDLRTLYRILLRVCAVLKGTDPTLVLQPAPERPGDIRHSSADLTRIRQVLGYAPAFTLEEGLQRLVASL